MITFSHHNHLNKTITYGVFKYNRTPYTNRGKQNDNKNTYGVKPKNTKKQTTITKDKDGLSANILKIAVIQLIS